MPLMRPPPPPACPPLLHRRAAVQVEKGAKHKAKVKAKQQGGGGGGGEAAAGDTPRQWNDYTVHFEFPEPTELPPPLLQLIDARWGPAAATPGDVCVCVWVVGG